MPRELLALVLAVSAAGCLVETRHVEDPGPAFAAARAEAERHEGRPTAARELRLLTYDPEDGEIVEMHVPLWLVRRLEDADEPSGRALSRVEDAVSLEMLDRAGRGALVEIEEADGERVLVWLK